MLKERGEARLEGWVLFMGGQQGANRKDPAGRRKGGLAWLPLRGGERQSMSQTLFDVLFDHSYPLNFQIIPSC